jgi:hypothetical protein
VFLCKRFNANSWRARRLRSPPLEHRWPGGEPGLADRTPGRPFRTMGRRLRRPPLTRGSFSLACRGLLNWEVRRAEASGRWRRRCRGAGGGGRGKPAGRTVPRPASLRPQLAGTDSRYTVADADLGRSGITEQGDKLGRRVRSSSPGVPRRAALNFGGVRRMIPEERGKTTPPTRKASSPFPTATWAPGCPLPVRHLCPPRACKIS